MKTLKLKAGSFLRIPLHDRTFGYGRMLQEPYVAFYDYRTTQPETDLQSLASKPVMFTQAVRTSGLKNWDAIGHMELDGEITRPAVFYMQDLRDYRKCVIFDTDGNERQATPEECVGIERASVWEPHNIEQRLLDTFMGRPNPAELSSRVCLK